MICGKKKFALVVWAVWFALLFGTPYFRLQPYSGALASGVYAYCALGFLLGLVAYGIVSRLASATIRPVSFAATICGAALSIVVFAYEWLALPAYFSGCFEVLPLHQLRLLMQWEKPLVCLVGCCCAFSGAVALLKSPYRADGGERAREKASWGSGGNDAFGFSALVAMAALFVCGLAETAVAALFFPFVEKGANASVVKVQTSDLLFWVVPLALFVVATLCAAFVQITNSNLLVSKRNSIGMIVLASFPAGLLTWNVFTRAIPVGGMNLASHFEISVIACVLFAASAFAAFAALRFSQKEAEGAGAQIEGGLQPGTSEAWSVIAAEHGLSIRETEVAALTASGETSDSIAVKLQIKAPTVRSYQQRIYRKMGISNREELLALGLAESAVNDKAKNEDLVDSQQLRQSHAAKACLIISIAGIVLAIALLVPFGEVPSWGVGRPVLFGAGLGFALAGAAFLSLDATNVHFWGSAKILVALACAAIVSAVPVALYKVVLLFGIGFGDVGGLSSAAFAGSLFFSLSLSCILRLRFSLCEVCSSQVTPSRLLHGLAFFTLGALIESLWRYALPTFASSSLLVFGVISIVGCTIFWFSVSKKGGIAFAAVALIALVFGAKGCLSVMAMLIVLTFCGVAALELRRSVIRPCDIALTCCCFGLGCLVALVGMDMLTDMFFFNQLRMDDMGGRNVVLQFVSMCFGVAAIALGLLHLTALYEARGSIALAKMAQLDSVKFSDRTEHYLYSKGLTSTQVEVAMRIAKGMSSRQISEELNYARGTINSARAAIYKLLQVNSRIQLIELLDKNISS